MPVQIAFVITVNLFDDSHTVSHFSGYFKGIFTIKLLAYHYVYNTKLPYISRMIQCDLNSV